MLPVAAAGNFESSSVRRGDLHPDCTESLLFDIFNAIGPVASIRVNRDAATRRSLGYAYVNYHQPGDAQRALETLNYTAILGRPCRIMWSHRDPSLRKSGVGNVFVKNLDKSIDNKALYDTFMAFGQIRSCKVAQDETGASRGYGYVAFETQEAAELAIEKVNGMLLNGKQVYVGPHMRKAQRSTGVNDNFTNVFVKNLDLNTDDDGFRKMFSEFGVITSCTVMKDETGKSKGFGFVNFEAPEMARAACDALNGKVVAPDRGPLYVGRAQKKAEREAEIRQKLDMERIQRQQKFQGVNVYVKNIDDQITEDKLREEFNPFGNIESCIIMRDSKTKISRGFGFVCFTSPEEAAKAVQETNGKMLSGKPLYVALYQPKDVRKAQLEAMMNTRQAAAFPQQQPFGRGGPGAPVYGGMPGQPVLYPPMFAPQQMYPPRNMMPGGVPGGRGGVPGGRGMPGGRGYPQPGMQILPGAANVPMGGRGMMPGGRGRGIAGRGMVAGRGGPMGPQGGPAPAMVPQAGPAQAGPGLIDVNASPEMQKQAIGEQIYPRVMATQPEQAAKITGMLLEMEVPDLLRLLENEELLQSKVTEAVAVLAQATTS
eukprot:tig00001264_g7884.t1